jgi:myo-inositol-1(or 4)-monophosphatase
MPYSLLAKALRFAAEKHDGEFREGRFGLPYSTHPFEVCTLLRYTGLVTDVELLSAAALHDILEETDVCSEEIEQEFSSRISNLVKKLTRTEPSIHQKVGLSKSDLWLLRSNLLLDDIKGMSKDAQIVKLADRLANLRQAKVTRKDEKLQRYKRQTQEILEIIPKKVNPGLWKAIAGELQ